MDSVAAEDLRSCSPAQPSASDDDSGGTALEILGTQLRAQGSTSTDVLRYDLADLLRPGRVLAAVVLDVPSAGKALLGIGQHRVLAHTPVELQVGRHMLLEVSRGAQGTILDVIGGASGESTLLRSLRAVLGQDRPVGKLLQDLASRLRSETGERATTLARHLSGHVFRPGAGGDALRALVRSAGLSYEAALLSALPGSAKSGASVASLLGDLKAQLMAELETLEPGSLRESVSRALAGIEAEQLLNLARRQAGEPLHLSFPVPDGSHWTTAHVFWRREGRNGEEPSETESTVRLSVGIRFRHTGPIRIDLWVAPTGMSLRLTVEHEEIAERIRADLSALSERISSLGRSAEIVVGVAPAEFVELERRAADIQYLREHHLMDVSG